MFCFDPEKITATDAGDWHGGEHDGKPCIGFFITTCDHGHKECVVVGEQVAKYMIAQLQGFVNKVGKDAN